MALSKKALAVECMMGLVVGFLVGYAFASGISALFSGVRFPSHFIPF